MLLPVPLFDLGWENLTLLDHTPQEVRPPKLATLLLRLYFLIGTSRVKNWRAVFHLRIHAGYAFVLPEKKEKSSKENNSN